MEKFSRTEKLLTITLILQIIALVVPFIKKVKILALEKSSAINIY